MRKEIRVTGRGRLSVTPDMIRLDIKISKTYPEYEETVRKAAEKTELLRKAVEKAGLDGRDLKTDYFNINTEYENEEYRGRWKRVFRGYRFTHHVNIKFDRDNELLGRVLGEIAECGAGAAFTIGHTVKDDSEARNRLLEITIRDAREKAELLAAASGVRLGEIDLIDYSVSQIEIYSEVCRDYEIEAALPGVVKSYAPTVPMNIESDDIDIHDSATVVWKIQ